MGRPARTGGVGVRTALALQWATFARSLTACVASTLLVLVPPVASIGLVVLARSGTMTGQSAAKFAPYAHGPLDQAVASLAGLVTPVIALIAVGFAAAWLFGREWIDRRIGSLFSLPVTRATLGHAKLAILAAWATVSITLAVLITLGATAVVAGLTADAAASLARAWVAGLLTAAVALPFAWVAIRSRGYLGAAGAIIGATAVSQLLAGVGIGAWIPYAAPALWAGAGGAEAAAGVGATHLAWVTIFATAGAWLSVRSFARARLDGH